MNKTDEDLYEEFVKQKTDKWIRLFNGKETDGYGKPWSDHVRDLNPFECFKAGFKAGLKAQCFGELVDSGLGKSCGKESTQAPEKRRHPLDVIADGFDEYTGSNPDTKGEKK